MTIWLDQPICDGGVADQAELAQFGRDSRAWLTQIMNLLFPAPETKEVILFLPEAVRGRDVVTERELRPIAAIPDWRKQRRLWAELQLRTKTGKSV